MYPLNRNISRSPNSRSMDCELRLTLRKNLSRFRGDAKFCDLKIRVQQHTFHVHRLMLAAMCEYFEAMFGGNFQNGGSTDITLDGLDVVVFEAILDSIYSGRMPPINVGNIYNLFTAAHYLGYRELVDACEEFLRDYASHPPMNLFEIFRFIFRTSGSLNDELIRCILLNFKNFIHDERFLEISYDDLNSLLEMYRSSKDTRFKDEKFLSKALIRWINHSPQERKGYFTSFVEAGHFDRTSTAAEPSSAYEDISNEILQEVCVDSPNDTPTIHIFADYKVEGQPTDHYQFKIFSLKNDRVVPQWFTSFKYRSDDERLNARSILTCTTFKGAFYCFKPKMSYQGHFYQRKSTLYRYSSLKFPVESPTLKLAKLPVVNSLRERPQMCGFGDDSIYLYRGVYSGPTPRELLIDGFTGNELSRGIYCYNCSVDKWFPVPQVKHHVCKPRLLSTDDLVYLIGGTEYTYLDSYQPRSTEYRHQAYDPRSNYWLSLPNSTHQYTGKVLAGRVNERIYVHNGVAMEAYDQRAGKWETIATDITNLDDLASRQTTSNPEQLISFENILYFFYRTSDGQKHFRTYDPAAGELSRMMTFPNDFSDCEDIAFDNTVIF